MRLSVTNVIIALACIVLIILMIFVYLRSRQGDERIIRAINQTFFPLLSAILITLGILFSNQGNSTCTGIPNILRYAAVIVAVLIIAIGVIRYIVSRNRDRRLITHPVLFAIIIVIAVFAFEQVYGCA